MLLLNFLISLLHSQLEKQYKCYFSWWNGSWKNSPVSFHARFFAGKAFCSSFFSQPCSFISCSFVMLRKFHIFSICRMGSRSLGLFLLLYLYPLCLTGLKNLESGFLIWMLLYMLVLVLVERLVIFSCLWDKSIYLIPSLYRHLVFNCFVQFKLDSWILNHNICLSYSYITIDHVRFCQL